MLANATEKRSQRPARSARQYRSGAGDCARLCQATPSELRKLSTLALHALEDSTEPNGHLVQRLHAFPFINYSPLQAESPLERVDHGLALVGESWLNAYAFLHALLQHFRKRMPEQVSPLEIKVKKIWRDAIFLAETAEVVARVTKTSLGVKAWLSPLMLGALEVSSLIASAHQEREESRGVNWQGPNALDVARLLVALDLQDTFRVPVGHEAPRGPWSVLSAAHELLPGQSRVGWATICLARIQPAIWPKGLEAVIGSQLASMQAASHHFADNAWEEVVSQPLTK